MARDMLQFTRLAAAAPTKRAADSRRKDFDEIYETWPEKDAGDQASRCEQCGIPFCQVHCPVQNNIPDWLKLTPKAGLKKLMQCRRPPTTCPKSADAFAARPSVRRQLRAGQSKHGTVTIGSIEKFIARSRHCDETQQTRVPRAASCALETTSPI